MGVPYDPTDVRGQESDKREAEAHKRLARKAEIDDLTWLMSSKKGRRIVWRLLDLSGPFRLSFDPNAMKMAFNEGNRNLGNQLLNEVMTHCPEMYPVMVKEQRNDRDGNGDPTKRSQRPD
jgi:3-oxoacyl-(acyl-carrier-protein) synthase